MHNNHEKLYYIKQIDFETLVISTPDRDEVVRQQGARPNGPPMNPYHIREWDFSEFERYISNHFKILEHSSAERMGQVIVATKNREGY